MASDRDNMDPNEAFRAEVAKGFRSISEALEVMQANLFVTRALLDLLQERRLLQLADVRERAMALAEAAATTPRALAALQQLLDEEGPTIPGLLQ